MLNKSLPAILFVVMVALAACAGNKPMEASVAFGDHYVLGPQVVVENLTVWPVYTDQPLDIGEFRTLREAAEKGDAVIREIGGTGGRQLEQTLNTALEQRAAQTETGAEVGRLVIENKGKLPILVCAGTIVKGGNQDRQIGQDFVVAAGTTVPVESFCVEQGRWSGMQEGKATNGQFGVTNYSAPVSVRASAQYAKNQAEVWRNVQKINDIRGTDGHGTSLNNATEKSDEQARDTEERLAKAVRVHFGKIGAKGGRLVGFAYAINGKPVSVRTFAHNRVFETQFGAFVQGMCMEAEVDQRAAKDSSWKRADARDVVAMVKGIEGGEAQETPTSAANVNAVVNGKAGYRNFCFIEAERTNAKGEKVKQRVALTKDWTRR